MPEILDPLAIWLGNMTSSHQPDPSQIVQWAKYIQRLAEEGVKVLSPCALATTGNVTLSGEQTIDGTLTSDTRVLVRAQTAPAENGIYNTGSGGWVRESDASTADELSLALVSVLGGETYAGTVWRTGLIETLGADPVIWVPGATDAVVTAITEYVDEETSGKLSIIGALGELSGPFAGTARTNIGAASQADLDAAEVAIAEKADADAVAAALADKADAADAALSGTPTAPTAAPGTDTTQIATTAFVQDAISGIGDTLQTIGISGTPTADSAIATSTYALAAAVSLPSGLRAVRLYSTGAGTVYVRRWDKSGDVFTQIGDDIELTVPSAGAYTFEAGVDFDPVDIAAGERLGWYSAGLISRVSGAGEPQYAGSGNVTTFTDSTTSATVTAQIGFDLVSNNVDRVQGDVDALADDVTAIETLTDDLSPVRVIGLSEAPAAYNGSATNTVMAFAQPVVVRSTLAQIDLHAANTGTLYVKIWEVTGQTFTQVGADIEIVIASVGRHTLVAGVDFDAADLLPGQFLGMHTNNVVAIRTSYSAHDDYWYIGTTALGNVAEFSTGVPSNIAQWQIGFTVTARPSSLGPDGLITPAAPYAVRTAPGAVLTAHLAYGQSWVVDNGNNTASAELQAPLYPVSILTLSDGKGLRGWGGAARTASTALIPAREELSTVQSVIGPMALRAAHNALRRGATPAIFARGEGQGGRSIAQLAAPDMAFYAGTSQAYTNLIAAVTNAVTLAAAIGLTVDVASVTWIQGQGDSATDYATYKTRLLALIDRIQTDVVAETGQRVPPRILIVQPPGDDTGGAWPCLQAQVDVAAERGDVILVAAGWAIPQHDVVHFDTDGAVQVGELLALAQEAVQIGQPWSAPYLTNVQRSGTTITADIAGPHGVAVDETVETPQHQVAGSPVANYGFEYSGASITAVTLEPRRITITLSADAGGTLAYAYHAGNRGDGWSVNRGTLRANWRGQAAYASDDLTLWLSSGYWVLS